ncbi:IgGFc-binding protein-like isoform X3 [Mytilus californianus]|uniref:IgGFc-binding protein-like isoform X1 n=1 Tax=Mytilus californianus TaxID=6549 RepID=UPI002247C9DD|nr:IgGFc-binding protein-like isoform X1 [Mytilus californianus]XP_052063170.1 IgGFc-binding protein-like isoform X2 [Mytilus californianus]XP_052063171.1 IgGFc-binding protein-like isoform X3 [Mytilus californianus]
MLPSCIVLVFCLLFRIINGKTLTNGSALNSTDLSSDKGQIINSSCETTYQCFGKLVCVNGQCQCCENHIWNGTDCINEKTFKSKCKHTTECGTTLFCIYGTCQCAQMHYWNRDTCLSKKTANDTCTNSNECGAKLLCEDEICQCPVDLFWNGNKCIFKQLVGHSCRSSTECVENLQCRQSLCKCLESEYWDKWKCFTKKYIDEVCRKEEECGTTLYCARSVCQCASSDYWTGSTCSIKKDENYLCNSSLECKATLQCRNNRCVCCEQDYWNGQLCEKSKCAFEQCLNGGKCLISENRHRCICVDGYLGDNCQYADGREKDFIVIFHQAYSSPSPRILPAVNRRGELSIFYFANNKNVSVTLDSAYSTYILDSNVLMTNGLHQAGVEIHSNVPILLYGFIFLPEFSEGFFVLPTRFVSVDYVIPSFTVYNSICQSVFALSSVYSNTVIEINFKMKDGTISYDNIQYSNNQTLTLVLNKYTSFQMFHSSDLTGTRIISSKPVVVVSGNRCNYIDKKISSCQPFIEMVLPTNQLDNLYVIPYLNYRPENTVRVLAVNNTNVVLKNGNHRTTNVLKSRDFLDYFHTHISYVSSASDVMVHIYPHELSDKHGDAFMMTIPGINQYMQYLYDYDFMVPTDFESFISITVATNAVDGFVLDGKFVNLKNIFSISQEEYRFSSFSIPISSGPHHITHREKTRFGLWVYGNYTNYEAYGYPAGIAFKT